MTKLNEQYNKVAEIFPDEIKSTTLAILNKCWIFAKQHMEWFVKQTITVLIVSYFLVPHINKNQQIEQQNGNEVDNFVQHIRALAYQDELTYLYCEQWKKEDINSSEFSNGLFAINTQRNTEFFNLLTIAKNIHKHELVNKKTYEELKIFTRWNNTLSYSKLNVCSFELKDHNQLESWTENIINEIHSNR
ncbi:MAG: hypothetical protein JSR33_04290 [Proteobacteria bacterium]|nr:hypothetical protein [Pseudomonadota bacterium]